MAVFSTGNFQRTRRCGALVAVCKNGPRLNPYEYRPIESWPNPEFIAGPYSRHNGVDQFEGFACKAPTHSQTLQAINWIYLEAVFPYRLAYSFANLRSPGGIMPDPQFAPCKDSTLWSGGNDRPCNGMTFLEVGYGAWTIHEINLNGITSTFSGVGDPPISTTHNYIGTDIVPFPGFTWSANFGSELTTDQVFEQGVTRWISNYDYSLMLSYVFPRHVSQDELEGANFCILPWITNSPIDNTPSGPNGTFFTSRMPNAETMFPRGIIMRSDSEDCRIRLRSYRDLCKNFLKGWTIKGKMTYKKAQIIQTYDGSNPIWDFTYSIGEWEDAGEREINITIPDFDANTETILEEWAFPINEGYVTVIDDFYLEKPDKP
jgi:hypothetical protein